MPPHCDARRTGLSTRARLFGAACAVVVATIVTVGLATHILTGIDTAVARAAHRDQLSALYWPARAGFSLGQNWVFPTLSLVLAVLLSWRRRSFRPLLAVVAVWLVHSIVVGAMKIAAGRQAPRSGHVWLYDFTVELGNRMSYPSGHIPNVLVFTGVLGVLLVSLTGDPRWQRRSLAVAAVSSVVCAGSMIYLGFHWTTDALAGFAVGAALRIGVVPALSAVLERGCEKTLRTVTES